MAYSALKQEKAKKIVLFMTFRKWFPHVLWRAASWEAREPETDRGFLTWKCTPPLCFLGKCLSFPFKDINSVLSSTMTRSGEVRSPWPGRGLGVADVGYSALPPSQVTLPLGTPFSLVSESHFNWATCYQDLPAHTLTLSHIIPFLNAGGELHPYLGLAASCLPQHPFCNSLDIEVWL